MSPGMGGGGELSTEIKILIKLGLCTSRPSPQVPSKGISSKGQSVPALSNSVLTWCETFEMNANAHSKASALYCLYCGLEGCVTEKKACATVLLCVTCIAGEVLNLSWESRKILPCYPLLSYPHCRWGWQGTVEALALLGHSTRRMLSTFLTRHHHQTKKPQRHTLSCFTCIRLNSREALETFLTCSLANKLSASLWQS